MFPSSLLTTSKFKGLQHCHYMHASDCPSGVLSLSEASCRCTDSKVRVEFNRCSSILGGVLFMGVR